MEADAALNNAIAFEVKKDGLQQRQSGDWVLRLTLTAADMDQRITNAPMGTRFQCVLVEINDDESPVDHKAEERDKWRDLGPVKQAGIRCHDPVFWAFLREDLHYSVNSEERAAEIVRNICEVTSRAELAKPGKSDERTRWYKLDFAFQAWRVQDARA
jgi:hypothetical protein